MAVTLKGRSLLTLLDWGPREIRHVLNLARDLKKSRKLGGTRLRGKHLVLLFEKTSTRTRCAFEVAMKDEGGQVTFLDKDSSQFGKKESIEDSAKVLARYYDAIEYRGYQQRVVEDLARFSGVPVYNGLTDVDHPTQILADLMTIEEHVQKPLSEVKVVFVGDTSSNMALAWLYGSAKMGMTLVTFGPEQLTPDGTALEAARAVARTTGAHIDCCHDVSCLDGADVIYTDVWVSMGQEGAMKEKVALLREFKVTQAMLAATNNPEVKFMHCLPAYHDFETVVAATARKEQGLDIREVEEEVFRGPASIVFDQAENRMHSIKAVLVSTLAD